MLCSHPTVLMSGSSSARHLPTRRLSHATTVESPELLPFLVEGRQAGCRSPPLSCAQVDLVLLPAVTGDFGVMPGHVPTVAQLRPGVVTVHHELDKAIEKFFVSSGFAFVHADSSTDVCAVEAVKLEDLDPEAVRAGLQARSLRVHQDPVLLQRMACFRRRCWRGPAAKRARQCPWQTSVLCVPGRRHAGCAAAHIC